MGDRTCSIENCDKRVKARELCASHYNEDRGRRLGPCAVEGCPRATKCRGWCDTHYKRWLEYGDPLGTRRTFRSVRPDGYVLVCDPDHPLAQKNGYVYEHRKVWFDSHGPIPPNHQIHHKNHDPSDNRLENLECLSNSAHQIEHKSTPRSRYRRSRRRVAPRPDLAPGRSTDHPPDPASTPPVQAPV